MTIEEPGRERRLDDADAVAEQVFANPTAYGSSGRRWIVAGCTAALAVIAAVDYWLGFEISFSLFYLFPIVGATWYGGRWTGVAFSVVGAALWALSDRMSGHSYSYRAAPYWNTGVRLAYFVLVSELVWRLQALVAHKRRESETDALTGVFNRNGWFEAAEVELARARRDGLPIAVAYIDLDDFKRVNDSRGHEEGDRVLHHVAATLRGSMRRSDVISRLGGDEFALFLVNVDAEGAKALCEKLHAALIAEMRKHGWTVGFSIGVAAYSKPPGSVREIVIKADQVMYDAKRAGKNHVRLGT